MNEFTNMAYLNSIANGSIYAHIRSNAALVGTTDTTADFIDGAGDDANSHTLEVYVAATGAVTFKIDGAAPAATQAGTLAPAATVVVPSIYYVKCQNGAANPILCTYECGLQ